MPILVAGSEGDWALHNNTLSAVGADTKRRGSVFIDGGSQLFKSFDGGDDVWVHVRLGAENMSGFFVDVDKTFLAIRTLSGQDLLTLVNKDLDNVTFWTHYIQYYDGDVMVTVPEEYSGTEGNFNDYDFRFRYSDTVFTDDTLTVDVYRDSQLRFSRTSVSDTGFGRPNNLIITSKAVISERDGVFVQDVIITNSVPTVGMELVTLDPNAAGNYSDFANDYTFIDDFGYDSNTAITTVTPTDRESWTFATPTFTLGDKFIYGVAVNTVAQTDIANAVADFQPFVRISATDYPMTALGANNITPDSYISVLTTNPATTVPWTEADLDTIESGILAL